MSLSNIKKMKDEQGFTIVELLIVIVIIAILAAIVFVAYANITQRARVSGYQSDANSIVKAAEAINAEEGAYPTTVNEFDTATIAKLPTNIDLDAPLNGTGGSPDADPTTEGDSEVSETNGVKTYQWKQCGANTGLEVYYWDGTTVKTVTAGTGC